MHFQRLQSGFLRLLSSASGFVIPEMRGVVQAGGPLRHRRGSVTPPREPTNVNEPRVNLRHMDYTCLFILLREASSMNRRQFLTAGAGFALAAGRGLAVPYADQKPRRVGLIGSGWYGKVHGCLNLTANR